MNQWGLKWDLVHNEGANLPATHGAGDLVGNYQARRHPPGEDSPHHVHYVRRQPPRHGHPCSRSPHFPLSLCSAAVPEEAIPQTPSLQLARTKIDHKGSVNREKLMMASKDWMFPVHRNRFSFIRVMETNQREKRIENKRISALLFLCLEQPWFVSRTMQQTEQPPISAKPSTMARKLGSCAASVVFQQEERN